MDAEAFDVEAVSGTARRATQRLLASAAARKKQWITASMDIDEAFLKGLTYCELAEATGEQGRMARCALPPGSASAPRALPGFSPDDESKHCFIALRQAQAPRTPPRASSLKLRTMTLVRGLKP
eukprot:7815107-Pyramimonas_sp.AAC.1